MSAHHRFNERKPQPTTFRISSLHPLLEHLEANLRGKSRAIILHGQDHGVLTCSKSYGNSACRGQVVAFVIKQVCDYSMKKGSVCQDCDRTGAPQIHPKSFFRHTRLV